MKPDIRRLSDVMQQVQAVIAMNSLGAAFNPTLTAPCLISVNRAVDVWCWALGFSDVKYWN